MSAPKDPEKRRLWLERKSAAAQGKTFSEETIEKMRQVQIGKRFSEETKEKQRQAMLGDRNPMKRPDVVAKVSRAMTLRATKDGRTRVPRALVLCEQRGCCLVCGISEWNGKPLTLELDHIDGDSENNSRENLRILCPNCHSQTPTYRRMKRVSTRSL